MLEVACSVAAASLKRSENQLKFQIVINMSKISTPIRGKHREPTHFFTPWIKSEEEEIKWNANTKMCSPSRLSRFSQRK